MVSPLHAEVCKYIVLLIIRTSRLTLFTFLSIFGGASHTWGTFPSKCSTRCNVRNLTKRKKMYIRAPRSTLLSICVYRNPPEQHKSSKVITYFFIYMYLS